MSYVRPDKKKLKTEAKENARKLLENIDDPADRVGNGFIYEKRPRPKSQSFDGYPYIHIDGVNIINTDSTQDGSLVSYTVDIEVHTWGKEDGNTVTGFFDEIVDQLLYLLSGPEKAVLAREAGMTAPNIIRNVDFTGVSAKDQPVARQETEFRTTIHKDMLA